MDRLFLEELETRGVGTTTLRCRAILSFRRELVLPLMGGAVLLHCVTGTGAKIPLLCECEIISSLNARMLTQCVKYLPEHLNWSTEAVNAVPVLYGRAIPYRIGRGLCAQELDHHQAVRSKSL